MTEEMQYLPEPDAAQADALADALLAGPGDIYDALDAFLPDDFHKFAWVAEFTISTAHTFLPEEEVDNSTWGLASLDDQDVGTGPRIAVAFLNRDTANLNALAPLAERDDIEEAFMILCGVAQSIAMRAFTTEHTPDCEFCDSDTHDDQESDK